MSSIGKMGRRPELNNPHPERFPEIKQKEIASLEISISDTLRRIREKQCETLR